MLIICFLLVLKCSLFVARVWPYYHRLLKLPNLVMMMAYNHCSPKQHVHQSYMLENHEHSLYSSSVFAFTRFVSIYSKVMWWSFNQDFITQGSNLHLIGRLWAQPLRHTHTLGGRHINVQHVGSSQPPKLCDLDCYF